MPTCAVYGWQHGGGSWLNYFAQCTRQLERRQPVAAPHDHWNTPVLVDDVARVVAALLAAQSPRLLHLGGPDRISRYDWAVTIAHALGCPPDFVRPVPLLRQRARPV